ncbi:hypothetical protein LX64_02981 [Chitinophaga skermanii]|uniref:CS1 type fimbrial major subunit n=1 Tax=Chitinophaga skermanii TaxID=331697 RepID=A0A327QL84_9BACT|nr:hypothetical protein [Chitinophaga skermanii]RAJ04103.1 hypothetical protein LX64_02981 [Chitinophaga skermanii]
MKNLKSCVAIAICGLLLSFSQKSSAQTTANTTLTVILNPVLVMTLSATPPTLTFATANDYANGVSATYANAITVTSTANYSITVKTSSADLANGANTIPVSNVNVAVSGTTGVGTTGSGALSTTDLAIVTNAPAAIAKGIGLTYSTTAGNPAFVGKPSGNYTTTLTFTATAL